MNEQKNTTLTEKTPKKRRRRKSKITPKLLLISLAALLVMLVLCGLSAWFLMLNPYRMSVNEFSEGLPVDEVIGSQAAVADLDYAMRQITSRHPMWKESDRLEQTQRVENVYQEQRQLLLDAESATVGDVWRAVAATMHELSDGHTACAVKPRNERYLVIDDTVSISDSASVTEIDGIPTTELYEQFEKIFSYELESYCKMNFESRIAVESYLKLLGINTDDGVVLTYTDGEGVSATDIDVACRFELPEEQNEQPEQAEPDFVSYTIDKENNAALFKLDECIYDEQYMEVTDRFFDEVADSNIENIIIDLRSNSGGNSNVADYFIEKLDVEQYKIIGDMDVRYGFYYSKNSYEPKSVEPSADAYKGNVYVLTSTQTFSSAMLFAVAIADNGIGTVVGEIPGNMPSSYGDIILLQCPNSKLCMTVSYKHFHRVDKQKDDSPLIPDIECAESEALDRVYEILGK